MTQSEQSDRKELRDYGSTVLVDGQILRNTARGASVYPLARLVTDCAMAAERDGIHAEHSLTVKVWWRS